jgi:exopolyphosphatase/guanosine-5'-triphosphate,3'-diphosphate pyrophosphatase
MRLGCDLSGRSSELLARTRLDFRAGVIVLQAEEAWVPILLGDQTAKRAQTLANLLDRDLKLRAMTPRTRAFVAVD